MTLKPEYYVPTLLNPKDAKRVFNPRFIDLTEENASVINPHSNIPFHEVDEFAYSMKIYNFSKRICHIGLRDSSVVTLRNTLPEELEGKRCYLQYMPRKINGEWSKPISEIAHQQVPKIREGIYFCIQKTISTSTKSTNKGTSSLMWSDGEIHNVVGEGYSELLTHDFSNQDKYHYKPYPDMDEYQEIGYQGPTLYQGEMERIYSKRTGYDWQAKRYYETLFIEYFVPIEAINHAEKHYIYLENLDVVLSTGLSYHEILHPYSKVGKLNTMGELIYQSIDKEHAKQLGGINIINVDNAGRGSVSDYFMNLGGCVVLVKAVADERLKNGVYFYLKNTMDKEGKEKELEQVYMTHSEAINHKREDLPRLYRTFSEAALHDANKLKQREEEEKLRELERTEKLNALKQQLQESQAKMDKLKLELEEAKLKRKDEYDQRSRQRDDYYDERSTRRKDDSEAFKWVLGVGGVVLGLAIKALL